MNSVFSRPASRSENVTPTRTMFKVFAPRSIAIDLSRLPAASARALMMRMAAERLLDSMVKKLKKLPGAKRPRSTSVAISVTTALKPSNPITIR